MKSVKSSQKKSPRSKAAAPRPPPIVGIGASAGGLEAFTQLLKHLPVDTGMGFVLVQHLAPRHESILAELLQRVTTMPVQEATNNLTIEGNHVYIIPPNRIMGLKGGILTLKNRRGDGVHHPIDLFLQALADEKREGAIGVILSGTATDGTIGLESVKEGGGITFAQDDSAKYESMPRSAVASGAVDFVLAPEKIAEELARISKHPYVQKSAVMEIGEATAVESKAEAGGENFEGILESLRRPFGVDFKLYKTSTIHRRIQRRMVLSQKGSVKDYERLLGEDGKELEALYGDLLIHVTSFFRNPEAFEKLKENVFPELVRDKGNEPVRVWSLGCSTGQEAYSIAIAYVEFTAASEKRMPGLQIFATDLNSAHLEKGRQGLYSKSLMQNVSDERKERFFTEEENGFRVSKALREMCVFARQNVLSDPPFSHIDLISCRNVLIYFEPELQKKIISSFHYALNSRGFLFLGASEAVTAFPELFELADRKQKIFLKKGPRSLGFQFPISTASSGARGDPGWAKARGPSTGPDLTALREADRIAVNRYAPPGVVINEKMQIVQFRGTTDAFLQPPTGKASFDILKMARDGLLLPLREMIAEAQKSGAVARRNKVEFESERDRRTVDLEVIPLTNLKERHCLVSFEMAQADAPGFLKSRKRTELLRFKAPERMEPAEEASALEKAMERLAQTEHELVETRDYMRVLQEHHEAANEELQSTNEEAQSGNEELQSINEELATSKEELESSNEELITLNEEMGRRSSELAESNGDLNNLHLSLNLPILLLGPDLSLRRCTTQAEQLFNVRSADVGKNFGDMDPPTVFENLAAVVREVIADGVAQEWETPDREGRWQNVRIRPYLTANKKIDGAVVIATDIDRLKRSEEEIKSGRDYLEAVLRTGRHPLIVLHPDLTIHTVNEAFHRTFRLTAAQVRERSIFEIGKGAWNTPKLRTLLKEILPRNSYFNDFEIEVDFPELGPRTFLLNARRLELDASGDMVLFTVEDVTERMESRVALKTSELRYRRLFEEARDGILMIDPISRIIIDANPFISSLLGFSHEFFLGKELHEIGLWADKEESQKAFRILQKEKILLVEHMELRTSQGEIREVEILSTLFRLDAEDVIKCNVRDITKRRAAELALKASQVRYRNLFDTIDEGFCIVEIIFNEAGEGIDYRFLEVNPAFEKQSGMKDVARKTAGELIPDLEPWWPATFGRVSKSGEPVRMVHEVKSLGRWFEIFAMRVEEGESSKVAILFNDVTRKRLTDESLRQAQEILADRARELESLVAQRTVRLEETVEELQVLTYTIAHNLRALLRGINGMCQALLEDYAEKLDPEAKGFAERAAASAVRMDRLIADLLKYAKLLNTAIVFRPTDVRVVVNHVLQQAGVFKMGERVRLTVNIPADLPPALAQPSTLAMALEQVIGNALKFAKPGGPAVINIAAEQKDGRVRLSVEDEGIGIDPEHQGKIFGIFERLNAEQDAGTGIGLALVERAVRRMDGACGVISELGKGSLFWIELKKA